jgi:hypothetical protein
MVWGMDMNTKARLLLVGVLVMVALSLLFSQFWGWTVYALQKIVALNIISLQAAVTHAVVICASYLLL